MTGELNEKFQNLLDRFNQSPESRIFAPLADAYRKRGDVEKAIAICEKGLRRFPDYASARVILGKCYYDNGASERSKTEFERVLELDPENMVALKFLGDIFSGENKKEKAAEYYGELLSIDPTNREVKKLLDQLTEKFTPKPIDLDEDESVEVSGKVTEPATMTLAGIYAAQGYYSRAMDIYRGILDKDPNNEEALKMVDKLKKLELSKESERNKVFDDDTMTISLDDVDGDITENTSGGGEKRVSTENNKGNEGGSSDKELLDTDEESGTGDSAPPLAESSVDDDKTEDDDSEENNRYEHKDEFMEWLNKMKNKKDTEG